VVAELPMKSAAYRWWSIQERFPASSTRHFGMR
jgi:hypothetical protein